MRSVTTRSHAVVEAARGDRHRLGRFDIGRRGLDERLVVGRPRLRAGAAARSRRATPRRGSPRSPTPPPAAEQPRRGAAGSRREPGGRRAASPAPPPGARARPRPSRAASAAAAPPPPRAWRSASRWPAAAGRRVARTAAISSSTRGWGERRISRVGVEERAQHVDQLVGAHRLRGRPQLGGLGGREIGEGRAGRRPSARGGGGPSRSTSRQSAPQILAAGAPRGRSPRARRRRRGRAARPRSRARAPGEEEPSSRATPASSSLPSP